MAKPLALVGGDGVGDAEELSHVVGEPKIGAAAVHQFTAGEPDEVVAAVEFVGPVAAEQVDHEELADVPPRLAAALAAESAVKVGSRHAGGDDVPLRIEIKAAADFFEKRVAVAAGFAPDSTDQIEARFGTDGGVAGLFVDFCEQCERADKRIR